MRRYRTFELLTAVTALLPVVMLSVVPSAGAGVLSPHKAPRVGRQLAALKGSGAGYNDRFGSEVAISGTTAVAGEAADMELATTWIWVFTRTKSGWKQVAKLRGSGPTRDTTDDSFGSSVAVSADTIVVGAPAYGAASFGDGRVYVFTRTKSGWKQSATLAESDPSADGGDNFGWAVAISGNTIVAGAPTHPYGTGSSAGNGEAYVFARHGAGWKQTAELKGTNEFGRSVAVSGATVVVGSPYDAGGGGRAYVYAETAGAWKRSATLKGSDTTDNGGPLEAGDHFGQSVAIAGTTIAVGAPQHAAVGRVYVFTRKRAWKQTAELKVKGGADLGDQVALSGSTLLANDALVASPVFVFSASRTGWKRIAVLSPPGAYGGDPAAPVAISGALAFAGSPTGGGNFSGRAYVYEA
jgi:trimeric autotransporter adhesin